MAGNPAQWGMDAPPLKVSPYYILLGTGLDRGGTLGPRPDLAGP